MTNYMPYATGNANICSHYKIIAGKLITMVQNKDKGSSDNWRLSHRIRNTIYISCGYLYSSGRRAWTGIHTGWVVNQASCLYPFAGFWTDSKWCWCTNKCIYLHFQFVFKYFLIIFYCLARHSFLDYYRSSCFQASIFRSQYIVK